MRPIGGDVTIVRSRGALLRISVVGAMLAAPVVMASTVATAGTASASSPAPAPTSTVGPFVAQGSARQVYATGLPANGKVALLNAAGHQVVSKNADAQGGVVFYDVAPGSGYRVRQVPSGPTSSPVTVHSEAAAPWDSNGSMTRRSPTAATAT